MRRTGAALAVVTALLLSGCGADSEKIERSGVDELEIPTPSPDPEDFVGYVDNPYFPLPDDGEWVYENSGGGTTTVRVEPTNLVVGGARITWVATTTDDVETVDYYAQDRDGNVWWFGRQGVWDVETGGQAGLAMPADPRIGDGWRRAFQEGVVEDRLTVLSVEDGTVVLRQESDLEPGVVTDLTYAKGFGLTESDGPDGTSELTGGP